MRDDELRRMFEFEDHYWWFVGRQGILRALLDRHLEPRAARCILDIGCGSGATLQQLARFGTCAGLDPAAEALRLCHRRGLRRLVQGDAARLPVGDERCHLVTALDVIEHVADDAGALAEIRRVLVPGGQLLMTVPAYQFLWSEHDEALDHYRRYTAGQVRQRLLESGFEVQRLTYVITFLLPAAVVLRVGQRLRHKPKGQPRCALIELPPLLNRMCRLSLELESWLLRRIDLPCGVSVAAVARRPED